MIFVTKYRIQPSLTLANSENLFYHSKNQDGLIRPESFQVTLKYQVPITIRPLFYFNSWGEQWDWFPWQLLNKSVNGPLAISLTALMPSSLPPIVLSFLACQPAVLRWRRIKPWLKCTKRARLASNMLWPSIWMNTLAYLKTIRKATIALCTAISLITLIFHLKILTCWMETRLILTQNAVSMKKKSVPTVKSTCLWAA